MAKYEVTYSCGHTATINLGGPEKQRREKIAYFEEEGICPDCYKAALEEENERLRRKAEGGVYTFHFSNGDTAEVKLPELKGSEKQIKWAEAIRVQKLDELTDRLESEGIEKALETGKEYGITDMQGVVDVFLGHRMFKIILADSASELIDNRF